MAGSVMGRVDLLGRLVVAATVVFCSSATTSAQDSGGQAAIDPYDFSGDWDRLTANVAFGNVPGASLAEGVTAQEAPFSAEGRVRHSANKPSYGPRRQRERNDPLGRCEPMGLVRNLNVEIIPPHSTFEIVQTPGRIFQFFEYRHDWREIWMDGRALPELEEANPSWNGYSVGRYENEMLIVESLGFDERSWVDNFGYPHSEQLRVVERYRRVDADTLELTVTIADPVIYTEQWVSNTKVFRLNRGKANGWDEQIYCVPADEFSFQRLLETGNVVE